MNHLKHILFASALVASMSAAAQETYQDTKLAASQLTGTARYVGMGGAMDLISGAKKVIVAMEHTAKGSMKILKECSLPLTAANEVNLIVTEMGVIEVTDKGLVLVEINPEFSVEQVQDLTEPELIIAEDLKPMDVE